MKYSLAASFAMAALVGAAPLDNNRDMVYSTLTVEEWVTEWTTTTVYADEVPAAPAAATPVGGYYEANSSSTPDAPPAAVTASPPSEPALPALPALPAVPAAPAVPSPPSEPAQPAAPVAPAAPSSSSTSTSPYVAPAPVSPPTPTSVAPEPAYQAPAPATTPAPTTLQPAYVAPVVSSPVAKAVATGTAATSGGSGSFTGDMTYYDVSVGLTSCGVTGANTDFLVAMNKPDMANGINPNNNPHCGQYINIYYNGVGPIKGKVVDTCPVCVSGAIDVTDSLFKAIAPNGDGRVHGVSWSWA